MFSVSKRFILFAICFFLSSAVYAVEFSGVVSDEGEPVAMAEIILSDAKTNIFSASRLSDKKGRFKFVVLEGDYNLHISKSGYAMVSMKGVKLQGDRFEQNIGLILAEFSTDIADSIEGLDDDSDGCGD